MSRAAGGRLPVGRLRVAGRLLDASGRDPAGEIPFEVAIPARSALIGQSETPRASWTAPRTTVRAFSTPGRTGTPRAQVTDASR